MKSKIKISTDKSLIDVDYVSDFISGSYWGKGRSRETMKTCTDNSLNFGVFLNQKQIGYGRVVTDYAQFAYILDLFIDKEHRGKGFGVELINEIMNHPKLKNIKVWRLATNDAHTLYEKFGFRSLSNPEFMMEKIVSE
jgi:GNAT superfamily N-acetyltransferase